MDTSNSDPPLTRTTGPSVQHRRTRESLNVPTEPLAQYQPNGQGQLSHITDATQLSHLISRADDVDMSSATTGIVSTGRIRRGVTTVTNSWDCPTIQSGDDTADTDYRLKLCTLWGVATTLLGVFTDD